MKPIRFPQANCVLAETQPEYLALPVCTLGDEPYRTMVSCWQLSLWERIKLFVTGRLWLAQMTFGQPLQPQLPSVTCMIPKELPYDE